jgi:hypothetical protein
MFGLYDLLTMQFTRTRVPRAGDRYVGPRENDMLAELKVFILKVALKGSRHISRKVAIRGDQTLDDLHKAIFGAFDRHDEHLYSFYMATSKGASRKRFLDAPCHTHPACFEGSCDMFETKSFNAAHTRVGDLKLKPKMTFEYLFDFGDEWWHEITVECLEDVRIGDKYPRVTDRHGESPPQYPDPEDE